MEFVYVVRRADLFERKTPHGLDVLAPTSRADLLARIRGRGFFVERRHAETDPSLKQVIPYCVLHRARDDEVFLLQRTRAGGETRLHGKRSIGVGGHVNPVDGAEDPGADVVEPGMRREIAEEVEIAGPWDARPVGLLNDDSTEVGAVHVGLVFVVAVRGDVRVRETRNLTGGFVAAAELARLCREDRESFETWSALLVDRLAAVLAG